MIAGPSSLAPITCPPHLGDPRDRSGASILLAPEVTVDCSVRRAPDITPTGFDWLEILLVAADVVRELSASLEKVVDVASRTEGIST